MAEAVTITELEPNEAAYKADEYVLGLLTAGHEPKRADLRYVAALLGPKHEPERVFARAEAMLKWARIAKPTADREAAVKNAKKFTNAAAKVREANLAKIAELQREIDQAESAAFQSQKAVSQTQEAFGKIKEFLPLWIVEQTEDETADLVKFTRRPLLDAEAELHQITVLLADGKQHTDHIEWLNWLRLNYPEYIIGRDGQAEVLPQLAADRPMWEAKAAELRTTIAELQQRYDAGLVRIQQRVEQYMNEVCDLEWSR
jgi:hypothetical protein